MQLEPDRLQHRRHHVAVGDAQGVNEAHHDEHVPALHEGGRLQRRNGEHRGLGCYGRLQLAHVVWLGLTRAGYATAAELSSRMRSAAFSATMRVGALILPELMFGKMAASTTRRPLTPRTRSRGSTTEARASAPIAQVPQAWNTEPARRRKSASTSASDCTCAPGSRSLSVTAASAGAAARRRTSRAPSYTSRRSASVAREFGTMAGLVSGSLERICTLPRLVGRQVLKDIRNPGNGSGFSRRRLAPMVVVP